MAQVPPGPLSSLRTVVDVGSVIDVENVYNSCLIIDAVDDPVGPASGVMTSGEWTKQRSADKVRAEGECSVAELQHGGSRLHCFILAGLQNALTAAAIPVMFTGTAVSTMTRSPRPTGRSYSARTSGGTLAST